MSDLLFVPLTGPQLAAWAAGAVLPGPRRAFTAGPGLRAAFAVADAEQAEHIALLAAGVAGLLTDGRRLVAVVRAPARPAPTGDADFGEVQVDDLPYRAVESLFADDPQVEATVAATAAAVSGRSLDQAWEHPAVQALLAASDLLWHGPTEWSSLLQR